MPARRTDSEPMLLEKIGAGTPLQAHGASRMGRKRTKRQSLENRLMVIVRRPIRLALQTERDRVDPDMTMSKFVREVVIAEWLADKGYTVKGMEREAMRQAIEEERKRLEEEEHGEGTPRYALEA